MLDGSKIAPLEPNKLGDTGASSLPWLARQERADGRGTDDFAAGADSATGRTGAQAATGAQSLMDQIAGAAKQALGATVGDSSLKTEGRQQADS